MTSVQGYQKGASRADLPIRLAMYAAEFALLSMVLLINADIFSRNILNSPIISTDELSGYLLVCVVLLGGAYSLRSGSFLRIEMVIGVLSAKAQQFFAILYNMVAILLCVILAWQFVRLVTLSYSRMVLAPTLLETPIWIPQVILPVGMVLLIYALMLDLWDSFHGRLHAMEEFSLGDDANGEASR
ncbi:MAG: TRAP transporter small permease [Jhaorihella sp.]